MYPARSFQVAPSQALLHPQYAPPYPHPHAVPSWAVPPSAPRMPPVIWVLAAMGLMAVLGAVFGTCGVVVGLAALEASGDDPGAAVIDKPER